MDREQAKEFEDLLKTRKQDLQTIMVHAEQMLREQLGPDASGDSQVDANHPADTLSGDPDYDKQINLIRRERAELALVTGALARIEQGHYGECLECSEDIPEDRLRALPYAKYCLECMKAKDDEANLHRNAGAPEADPRNVSHLGL